MTSNRRARPSIPATYRIPADLVLKIDEYAEKTGISRTQIVIQALEDFFLCLDAQKESEGK